MRSRDDVILLGEDIGKYGGAFGVTRGLWKKFGSERVLDTPISENTIAGCAIGAALTGLRPIAEIMFMDFVTLAMDQIVNQAAKIHYLTLGQRKVPLVFRIPQGRQEGQAAQHSQSFEAWFVHTPGLKVVAPSTPYDAKGLLKTSCRDDNPVIFIEHKSLYLSKGNVPKKEYFIPLGKADIKKVGTDVTLICNGLLLHLALQAAQKLEKEAISIEIVDPRSYKPLDIQTITNSVKKTGRVIILQESYPMCGVAAEIGMSIMEHCFDYLDAPIQRITAMDAPIPFDKEEQNAILPDIDDICKAVQMLIARKSTC